MKNKLIDCFVILFFALSPFGIQQSASASEVGTKSPFEGKPLSVVFLMDSSGSMKKTDPDEIRKLASQVVITLLSPEDKVAVVEFDSDARLLSEWRPASEKDALFSAINRLGNNGSFTDFRVGLETAKSLFNKITEPSNKVILLLSDGVFEPDPYNEKYAPYSLQYRIATRGKSKADLLRINDEFKSKLTPVAKRIVDGEILPDLKSKGIEIYTVGFSPDADKNFLNYLADETSATKTESHYFYANNAVDLMDTFVGILHFWANKIKLGTESDEIVLGVQRKIALDSFLKDVSFIVLTEKDADMAVKAEGNYEPEEMLRGIHPKLKIFNVSKKSPPGKWTYGFNKGSGKYRLLLTGKSTLDMAVAGLKEKYAYGEPIRAHVSLKYNTQDARTYLSSASKITAEVSSDDSKSTPFDLKEDKDGFSLEYLAKAPGKIRLKFTLFAKDKQNNDFLPRPSKEYRLEVLPRFYVEPEQIKFGDLGIGKTKEHDIKVHSGLPEYIHVRVSSIIKNASRCQEAVGKLPYVKSNEFPLSSGQSFSGKVALFIPEKGCWGDFDGEILFLSDKGESAKIGFRVHVPSIWERIMLLLLLLIILIIFTLGYLIYIWGYLGTPSGVLIPSQAPPGESLLSNYYLSQARPGLFSRWFNWKRNVIHIRNRRPGIFLSQLPSDFMIDLRFHRFGGAYIRNASATGSEYVVMVEEPLGGSYQLYQGQSVRLKNASFIGFEGYKFTYEI